MADIDQSQAAEKRIPDEWKDIYLSRPVRPQDVTELFDRHFRLNKAKDEINSRLLAAQSKLNKAALKIWLLTIVMGAQGALILLLINRVIDLLSKR